MKLHNPRPALIALGGVAIAGCLVFAGSLVLVGTFHEKAETSTSRFSETSSTVFSPTTTSTPSAPAVVAVPVTRILIPGLAVSASVIQLGVDATGTMQAPDNPTDVAW